MQPSIPSPQSPSQKEKDQHLIERVREARKLMTRLTTIINIWMRIKIRRSTPPQLLTAEKDLWKWSRSPLNEKIPSKGKQQKLLIDHPLYKLLFEETVRREKRLGEIDPNNYYGSFNNMTIKEANEYFIWKSNEKKSLKPTEESIKDWRKSRSRIDVQFRIDAQSQLVLKNEEKSNTNNRRLPESGEGIVSPGHNLPDGPETGHEVKVQIKEEKRAYGPRRKN